MFEKRTALKQIMQQIVTAVSLLSHDDRAFDFGSVQVGKGVVRVRYSRQTVPCVRVWSSDLPLLEMVLSRVERNRSGLQLSNPYVADDRGWEFTVQLPQP